MVLSVNPEQFKYSDEVAKAVTGKRVLITGSGKDLGIGQGFALAAALNGAASVGVHFFRSYGDAMKTIDMINANGGNAFPVQADVTNTSDAWAMRTHVINKMGGLPPDLVICNSGLSEKGYLLGRAPRSKEEETTATRRARVRQSFVDNLLDSTQVMQTKMDGYLYMTHLWAGESLHYNTPLQLVYISSRQAVDPGAGVPGYALANYGVLALPKVLRTNLGRQGEAISAFSIAFPFIRTGMTQEYVENTKVFGRWQPRMLESHEASEALLQLLGRPKAELDDKIYQLNVETAGDHVDVTWSQVQLTPQFATVAWSRETPLEVPATIDYS